jgi:3-oxoadipate enol-lactonase
MSERPAGIGLAASLEGSDRLPVLVLGNSLGTSREVWGPQLPALAARFRLLRYELPGHGAGPHDPPPGPYRVGDLGSAVLGLLDRHGIDQACYAGISLGGMIGMWLAARAPARIAALGLCCTSAWLPPASGWLARAARVRSAGMAAITGQALARWFTPPFLRCSPPAAALAAAMLESADPEGYAGCCEAIAAMDLRPVLGSITAPTLVIAASEDPATPPVHGALIASKVPGARLTVIRGASHLANLQAPGPVTAALLAHLGSITRERSPGLPGRRAAPG